MSDPFFYTWSKQKHVRARHIVGGEGATLNTKDGVSWLDLGSLSYQANLGYGHPRMIQAIKTQADAFCLAPPNADYPAKRQLAEALLALAPKEFTRVFFTLSGAEAIENAMKISRLVTGRHHYVSRTRSYHGATFGALSLTGDHRRPPLEPVLSGVTRVSDDSHIPAVLKQSKNVAAVFLEAVPGANGVYVTPKETWQDIRRACDESKTLLCVDEVLTGFGRTGKAFGVEHFDVVPDLICVAKALTGGYMPLGAVLVHEKHAAQFDEQTLWAGLTHYAHPLGCAAGLEALSVYSDEKLFQQGNLLSSRLIEPLEAIRKRFPDVATDVRGLGCLAAIDLKMNKEQWRRLETEIEKRHIIAHVYPKRGYVVFAPPLIISAQELERGMTLFTEAVDSTLS